MREFRGIWVATVANIDWPSRPGLTTAQQQAELRTLLDRASQLKLNAVVLQVRTSCDALYESKLEPWSEFLTGQMGRPPEPFYDPLAFAVREAHARGMELHAWINPFRARHPSAKHPVASNHVSKTQPQLVRAYGRHLWLDPGEPAAREYTLRVLLDIVRRYDVDGLHMDDYFYPYQEKATNGATLDFPDEAPWQRYVKSGGKMPRADWRRDNINRFIEKLYGAVKAEKPWVKVGISPFGIWRDKTPPSIIGLDAYDKLYADSRLWLEKGWLDYFAPQLYWSIEAPGQSFPVLFNWWKLQNPKERPIWPGLNAHKVLKEWPPQQIARQVRITRHQKAPGQILWSATPVLANPTNVANTLRQEVYADRALVPPMPWRSRKTPPTPRIYTGGNEAQDLVTLNFSLAGTNAPVWWVVRTATKDRWQTEILDGSRHMLQLTGPNFPDTVAVYVMDRYGQLSLPVVLSKRKQ